MICTMYVLECDREERGIGDFISDVMLGYDSTRCQKARNFRVRVLKSGDASLIIIMTLAYTIHHAG